jgi:hypothetical protein
MHSETLEIGSVNPDTLGLRSESIPDEIPTPKQKTLATLYKLQGMAAACHDKSLEARVWLYDHQIEMKNVKLCLGIIAADIVLGYAIVYGMDYLEKLKLP